MDEAISLKDEENEEEEPLKSSNKEREELEEVSNETSKKPDKISEEKDKAKELTSEELEAKNRRLRARLAKENERLYSALKEVELKRKVADLPDPLNLAKTVASLKDYSAEELDYIGLVSKAKGISLTEAVKTDEVKLFIPALRERTKKESKGLEPETKQFSTGKEPDYWKMSKEEFRKFQDEVRQKGRD